MKKNRLVLALSTSFLIGNAFAGTMGPVKPSWRWLGEFSVGPAWQSGGSTQSFYLDSDIEKTYAANKSTHAMADFGVLLGAQYSLNPTLITQFGLAVGATTDTSLSGEIWDDADPQFNNFIYSYKLQHTHLAVKGKLLADMGYMVMPWISASVGVGFNHAYAFNNVPIIEEAIKNPNFSAHTQTSFTYTLGAGIQRSLTEHIQVGIGYEFADWGKSSLGKASGQTMNTGISLNHLYTNGFLVNLTYVG
ncbi:outer membrane protein [Legionella rowbothamii]|uniref:outer membrane protein n=1 Tax=Legionella rowbothamii TaxID=96229 RepID=UPI0010557128|nr:porin family protein [Legionella rowbothamii]